MFEEAIELGALRWVQLRCDLFAEVTHFFLDFAADRLVELAHALLAGADVAVDALLLSGGEVQALGHAPHELHARGCPMRGACFSSGPRLSLGLGAVHLGSPV